MYRGSMVGCGALNFALMGYVIANSVPDRKLGSIVELNPILLATIFGEDEKDVVAAIKFLCSPDPKSRTKVKDGRRLIKLGEFDYQVVNGEKYRAIRDEEQRREQNRIAQANHRMKKNQPLPGEQKYEAALNNGDTEQAEKIVTENLPPSLQ